MRRLMAVGTLGLMTWACGGDSPTAPPPPPPPTAASITVTASPNPIIAADCTPATCGNSGFRYAASTTLTVTESAGVGGNVDFVNMTLRSGTTNTEVGTLNFGSGEISSFAGGTNHVNPRGSLAIRNIGIVYTLGGNARQATMTVAVQFTDDKGNRTNHLVTVPVT
jgi:hypothetical protein